MIYRIFADLIVIIHFLWIIFLFTGAIWGRKNSGIRILHLSGIAFALFIQILNFYCPLTYLETWLRSKQNPLLLPIDSFIIYYIEKLIYIEISPWVILLFTIILFAFNILLYLKLLSLRSYKQSNNSPKY